MKKHSVLVVDDEKNTSTGIKYALDRQRYEVEMADNITDGLRLFRANRHHIVITDLRMENEDDGMRLLTSIKAESPETVVIMMTAYGDMEKAVTAMQQGAFDFVAKPFTADQIEVRVNRAAETINLVQDNMFLSNELHREYEMVGDSACMKQLREQISLVAATNRTVLVVGENGSGKELVARAIQKLSDRRTRPFVQVNCAAIPETLIEAELFGSKKGAFTQSIENKTGKFEQADGGTIFLDEIGDMSLAAQAKVLRVLETGEVSPIGSDKLSYVDVRVVAATNKDLAGMIKAGTFREDLYYRLNVIPIQVPPLVERRDDIPALASWFLQKAGGPADCQRLFSPGALKRLKSWSWPGNVRELRNVVERAYILGRNQLIDENQIGRYLMPTCSNGSDDGSRGDFIDKPLKEARDDFERDYIRQALSNNENNRTKAAEQLGLSRGHLHNKMAELGIE
jgi:two-component system nitrogen regulation response regulator NtrX